MKVKHQGRKACLAKAHQLNKATQVEMLLSQVGPGQEGEVGVWGASGRGDIPLATPSVPVSR